MSADTVFPEWIENGYEGIRSNLSPAGAKSVDRFRAQYGRLIQELQPLPAQVEMYEIYQITPKKLQGFFPDAFSALAHCCEYMVGYWFYRHVYKIKSYVDGLNYSLESGNWLLACTCLRNIFEEVAHFDLYLSRIDRSASKISQLEKNEAKRIRQGKRPPEKWIKDYITCDLDIIQNLEKAIQGSDFDWRSWLQRCLVDTQAESVDLEILKHSESRKTHINDCIASMEKTHKKKFSPHYDLLSDMVHPNFGSNTLVIITREKFTDMFGRVSMAGSIKNQEAACWFFEIASDTMTEPLSIASRNILIVKSLYAAFQSRAVRSSSEIGQLLTSPRPDSQRLN